MSLKDDRQPNIQLELDFSPALTGETRTAGREETESSGAMNEPKTQLTRFDGWRKYVSEKT
jgi:hypothetical protein